MHCCISVEYRPSCACFVEIRAGKAVHLGVNRITSTRLPCNVIPLWKWRKPCSLYAYVTVCGICRRLLSCDTPCLKQINFCIHNLSLCLFYIAVSQIKTLRYPSCCFAELVRRPAATFFPLKAVARTRSTHRVCCRPKDLIISHSQSPSFLRMHCVSFYID